MHRLIVFLALCGFEFWALHCRVDMSLYENLISMGYGRGAAAAALKQTNNDLNQALEVKLEVSIGTFVLLKKRFIIFRNKNINFIAIKSTFFWSQQHVNIIIWNSKVMDWEWFDVYIVYAKNWDKKWTKKLSNHS